MCVLQLGAAVVRAAECLKGKRWLGWRWSFLLLGSKGVLWCEEGFGS